MTNAAAVPERDSDINVAERRYRDERDKRLQAGGVAQYVEIEIGSSLEVDPFVRSVDPRDPLVRTVEVLVVGGGFSALLCAVELHKAGINDLLIVEKGADFGGTWYWNRYPGLCCDVESYIYLPLLEELGYMPRQRYSDGEEILDHAKRIARHWSLYERAVFQTRCTEISWDEDEQRWLVCTNRGDQLRARSIVLATGGLLHRPKLPGIPGLETFRGKSFHTSRWDYDYTGGNQSGGLTGLKDKRVALIGTGATALQVVPHLGADARELVVFQRTPTAVDIRDNQPTDSEWFSQLEPGWQRRRMVNFDALLGGIPQGEDLVGDQWTQIWGLPKLEVPADGSAPDMVGFLRRMRENDYVQMERIRARIDQLVDDPATADALKPWFATHCKRPGFHDGYLQTFNRPNVSLVHTKGRGPDRISENAVHFDGTAYEVDCIIYATGFEAAVSPARAGGFQICGRGGESLEQRWSKDFRSLHGILTAGFPNMFVVGGIRHAAVSVNVLFVNAMQARHVAKTITDLRSRGVISMEITTAAEDYWADKIAASSVYDEEAARACTPGFYNNEGDLNGSGTATPLWAHAFGGGHVAYEELLDEWRRDLMEEHSVFIHPKPTTNT